MNTNKKKRLTQINTSLRASDSERSNLKYRDCFSRNSGCRAVGIAMTIMTMMWIMLLCGSAHCFSVSPNRIEISVAPSKGYEEVLVVKNPDKTLLDIKLRIEERSKTSTDFKWIEISPLEFELNGDGIKEVRLKVNIPKKAKGEFSAMIFIEGRPKEVKEGAIVINTSIGIPIYAMVKGTEQFNAEVEELKIVNNSPLALELKIKNSGNVHIRPTGTIVIARGTEEIPRLSLRGAPKERRSNLKTGSEQAPQSPIIVLSLNEYNYPILPNSSRTLEIKSNTRLEKGEYSADIKMGFQNKKHRKRIKLEVQ